MINHTAPNANPEIQCKFGEVIKKLGISKPARAGMGKNQLPDKSRA